MTSGPTSIYYSSPPCAHCNPRSTFYAPTGPTIPLERGSFGQSSTLPFLKMQVKSGVPRRNFPLPLANERNQNLPSRSANAPADRTVPRGNKTVCSYSMLCVRLPHIRAWPLPPVFLPQSQRVYRQRLRTLRELVLPSHQLRQVLEVQRRKFLPIRLRNKNLHTRLPLVQAVRNGSVRFHNSLLDPRILRIFVSTGTAVT